VENVVGLMTGKFEEKNGELYIDGKKVLKGWESFSGWYWFATEKVEDRKKGSESGGSIIEGKEKDDTIWYGYVQGLEDEWGNFSQAELEDLKPKVWELPKKSLVWSGRRKLDKVI
jgi:hypothetical protein